MLWFAGGFAAAMLVSAPRAAAAYLLVCIDTASLLAGTIVGDTLAASARFVIPNMLESVLAAALAIRGGAHLRFEQSPERFLRFVLATCVLPPLAGTTCGALLQGDSSPGWSLWLAWLAGSVIGMLAMLPLARAGVPRFLAALNWRRMHSVRPRCGT